MTFKDPDAIDDLCRGILTTNETLIDYYKDIACDEAMRDKRNKLLKFLDQWIRYEQYVDIEFDTEANTATVIKNNRSK